MAPQGERVDVEDVGSGLFGDEVDEPGRIQVSRLSHDAGMGETRHLRRQRGHMIERIRDDDDHAVGRAGNDLLGDLLDDLGVDLEEVHAAHARLARQTGRDDDDVASCGVGVVVGADHLGAVSLYRARLVHVEGEALGESLDDVGHDDLVGEVGLGEALRGRRPVLAGSDDGDLGH